MAPPPPQQTTPLTPPSTPPTPKAPILGPLPTTTALLAPPLRLSPSPSPFSSSYSPLSTHSSTSNLPRITITLNNRTIPPLPWRPCNPQSPRYESLYLAPPHPSELSRQHRQRRRQQQKQQLQREHERQAQQHAEQEELLLLEASHLSILEATETLQLPSLSLLRPIARELVCWRMLTFYNLNANLTGAATAVEAMARANILAAGVDWQRTWVLLQGQQARYLARQRRSLGLLSKMNLRGLNILRVVHRTVASAGVSVEQLILAIEAFAKREGGKGVSMSVGELVARQEWEVLARVVLMDREMPGREREVVFPTSRFGKDGVWHQICRKWEEVARRHICGLEYEERCAGCCCFTSCGKKRIVYQLSRREHARLDGSLELQGQRRRGVHSTRTGPSRRESESDKGDEGRRDSGSKVQAQKKRVRISEDVDVEQDVRSESASRASWDSEEKRRERRQEKREFVFGKEDEDEDESDAEDETDEQREEKERKRKQSLERILVANAKWKEKYADY